MKHLGNEKGSTLMIVLGAIVFVTTSSLLASRMIKQGANQFDFEQKKQTEARVNNDAEGFFASFNGCVDTFGATGIGLNFNPIDNQVIVDATKVSAFNGDVIKGKNLGLKNYATTIRAILPAPKPGSVPEAPNPIAYQDGLLRRVFGTMEIDIKNPEDAQDFFRTESIPMVFDFSNTGGNWSLQNCYANKQDEEALTRGCKLVGGQFDVIDKQCKMVQKKVDFRGGSITVTNELTENVKESVCEGQLSVLKQNHEHPVVNPVADPQLLTNMCVRPKWGGCIHPDGTTQRNATERNFPRKKVGSRNVSRIVSRFLIEGSTPRIKRVFAQMELVSATVNKIPGKTVSGVPTDVIALALEEFNGAGTLSNIATVKFLTAVGFLAGPGIAVGLAAVNTLAAGRCARKKWRITPRYLCMNGEWEITSVRIERKKKKRRSLGCKYTDEPGQVALTAFEIADGILN